MVETYSSYISRYVDKAGLKGNPLPGEHHFVSVYLIPKLFELNGLVPDYVNPDGTKRLIGDVIYFDRGSHRCGIEVKLGTIRLTANEFNRWIVGEDRRLWPNVFLGVCRLGVVLLTWAEFRERYIESVREKIPTWTPGKLRAGAYGPLKEVGVLMAGHQRASRFPFSSDPEIAGRHERRFLNALRHAIL